MFSKPKPVSRKDAKIAKKSDAFVFKDLSGSWVFRFMTAALVLLCLAGVSSAAGVKVVPSALKVTPGETFAVDVVVEDIPSEGVGAIQFRLNISAPGSTVAAVSDASQGQTSDVSVSTPLIVGPPTLTRSGISDFFWNAKGSHGILVMDNEALQNGSGMYTIGHTNGAALPSGSGSVARFQINAGKEAAAEKIVISLSDVVLLDGSTVYPIDSNTAATIDLKCYTQVPNLIGLSGSDAATALSTAKLSLGTIYEIDNAAGTHSLNSVLVQSSNPGTTILCETPVDLAINTPPSEAGNVRAVDKAADESGIVLISWLPSSSSDTAGYRVYSASGLRLADIANPAATGTEISGLTSGTASQLRIAAYDTYGNESPGVTISATALDDVAPRITVTGVAEGAYYASDVQPVVTVLDANLATKQITLNEVTYNQLPVTLEANYLLKVSATDTSGNSSVKEMRFTVDKTAPAISVTGIAKGTYYNRDLSPVISVTDANLEKAESFLNASVYTSGTAITAENNYELAIQAVDKAGNSSSDTYQFFIDKTKPTSTVAIGSPKFENNAVLYVADSTAFTLNGNDAGTVVSGVDKLEYRANGGGWNQYQTPVTLAGLNDGAMTMDYRAVDRATNIEDFHTLAVTLDTTAPVTTLSLGVPRYVDAAGSTYVTQNTSFTLSASDALSGVASTEYKLDAGNWTAATPFTISGEGSHTIVYHSKDNVGNPETDKSFNPVVDNTPPVTSISIGDPKYTAADGKLYVTGASTFTLSAMDNLSGVAKTEYRIDNGTLQTYTGSFSLAGTKAGQYTITFKSTDNVLNEEAEKTITVRLIIIEVEKKVAADSVVLVGFESDKSDFDQKQADIQKLSSLLASLNLTYTVAQNMDEFTTAMRSGRYNTYILVDVKEPLINEEVREAVHYGDALIFIKTRPNADPFLDDVFGVKFSGKTTSDNLIVDLLSTPISSEGSLQTTGKSVVSTITGESAQVFGSAVDKHDTCPSVVFNQYKQGKVLLYTFDLMNTADQSLASALMIESLNFVRPQESTPRALSSVPLRITLKNSTEPVDVKVSETFPSGTAVDTVIPKVTPVDNTLTWQKSLSANEKARFGYYLNLPDIAGDYTTKTNLAYGNNGFFISYGQYELVLTVQNNSNELLQKIIAELRSTEVKTVTDAELAAKAVENLLLLNVNAANRKEAEDNIRYIVQAIDEVRKLSVDVATVRIELDELLKVWEKKWYLMESPR